tara:strand:- start:12370 stop:12957 length:588 start_codon:yes stop_codon:yes gene_type:complete
MKPPILSSRARLSLTQAGALLKGYAARLSPKDAAEATALAVNTVYKQYERIRDRLIAVRYYADGALSLDEAGLAEGVQQQLRLRRGIRDDEVYPHAAELIDWAEEWPPRLIEKHIRKIIELSGPLDAPFELDEPAYEKLRAYVRYARTELIHDRVKAQAEIDETQQPFLERVKDALDTEWRAYRAASKRVERDRR